MKLFDNDGNLDYEAARTEHKATEHVTPAMRADRYQAIGVACLIEIASSLSILGLEAAQAMNLEGIVAALNDEPEEEGDRDFLLVGDLVHVLDDTEPGEVVKLGFDQGEAYADVHFANGHADRYYVRNLVRIVGDEAPDEVVENAVELVDTALELTDPPAASTLDELDPFADVAETFDEFADDDVSTHEGEPGALYDGDLAEDFDESPADPVAKLGELAAKPVKKKGGKK